MPNPWNKKGVKSNAKKALIITLLPIPLRIVGKVTMGRKLKMIENEPGLVCVFFLILFCLMVHDSLEAGGYI